MDYTNFLWRLALAFTDLRTAGSTSGLHNRIVWIAVRSLIFRGIEEGFLTHLESDRLFDLARNAIIHCSDLRFPDPRNAGPWMPDSVWYERHQFELKLQAEVPADVPQVSRQAPSVGLRLLCVLDQSRTGEAPRSFPICTMRPMPPRLAPKGRWSLGHNSGFYLREAHAKPAPASLLARGFQHGQTHAVCTDTRAV